MSCDSERKHTLDSTISETGVQTVDGLVKDSRRHLFALLVDQVDLDRPRALREALDLGWLVTISTRTSQSAHLVSYAPMCTPASDGRYARAYSAPIGPVT